MNKRLLMRPVHIIWYLFWGLFVNALNVWMIGPLVQDLAMYGVICVGLIVVLWLTSLRVNGRRGWVSYTLMSLLLGQGLASLTFSGVTKGIVATVVMTVGLIVFCIWFGKSRWIATIIGALGVVVGNLLLPYTDWAFLTQFHVVQDSRVHIDQHTMADAPFSVVHTPSGDAVITITGVTPTTQRLQSLASQATGSPNALYEAVQAAENGYRLVELKQVGGKVRLVNPPAADLAYLNPLQLIRTFFPYQIAHWYVSNGQVVEYLTPNLSVQDATETAVDPAAYANALQAISNQAVQTELNNWNQVLQDLGVQPKANGLVVSNGVLTGTEQGTQVNIPVSSGGVVGVGHFWPGSGTQVLLTGNNDLQIVDLATRRVVTTYKGSAATPIPNDIVIGPLQQGGPDAIFVNASPAYILTVNKSGQWKQVYTAPNQSLRFETVMATAGAPDIVTDDPSAYRNSPTRYFSSYHYVTLASGQGQLIRDWRVYRTNVVNVTPVHFTKNGPDELVIGIYGSGEYLVLQKSSFPVLPIALVVFGLTIVGGWVLRLRRGKAGENA